MLRHIFLDTVLICHRICFFIAPVSTQQIFNNTKFYFSALWSREHFYKMSHWFSQLPSKTGINVHIFFNQPETQWLAQWRTKARTFNSVLYSFFLLLNHDVSFISKIWNCSGHLPNYSFKFPVFRKILNGNLSL